MSSIKPYWIEDTTECGSQGCVVIATSVDDALNQGEEIYGADRDHWDTRAFDVDTAEGEGLEELRRVTHLIDTAVALATKAERDRCLKYARRAMDMLSKGGDAFNHSYDCARFISSGISSGEDVDADESEED